jgi:hypothetical protein
MFPVGLCGTVGIILLSSGYNNSYPLKAALCLKEELVYPGMQYQSQRAAAIFMFHIYKASFIFFENLLLHEVYVCCATALLVAVMSFPPLNSAEPYCWQNG